MQGNVYVLAYGSAAGQREGRRKKESSEGKTEECSSLGRDALEVVGGETGEKKRKRTFLFKI